MIYSRFEQTEHVNAQIQRMQEVLAKQEAEKVTHYVADMFNAKLSTKMALMKELSRSINQNIQ